ncbi:hypothetical protein ACS0TY_023269 [Phlomoides rotata]
MKTHWGILSSASHYPIKTQTRLILACSLIHNFILTEMPIDPIEECLDAETDETENNDDHGDFIATVKATPEWTAHREALAQQIWADYNNGA